MFNIFKKNRVAATEGAAQTITTDNIEAAEPLVDYASMNERQLVESQLEKAKRDYESARTNAQRYFSDRLRRAYELELTMIDEREQRQKELAQAKADLEANRKMYVEQLEAAQGKGATT